GVDLLGGLAGEAVWNTVVRTADHEARPAVRPLSRGEVQAFFDYADDRVDQARTQGKKRWKSVFRDATLFNDDPRLRAAPPRGLLRRPAGEHVVEDPLLRAQQSHIVRSQRR